MVNIFDNATEAFEYYVDKCMRYGKKHGDTLALFDECFKIINPMDNVITTKIRKFSKSYAEKEWEWYLSGNPNAEEISKHAKIWLNHMDENGNVQSNYGWQWKREEQLSKVLEKLKVNPNSRQAVVSIYDGKEIHNYKYDTPCTTTIQFQIVNKKLNMTVCMRSNDIWFGFCNDQYMFSNLLNYACAILEIEMGTYTHFAANLHLYNKQIIDKQLWKILKK